MCVGPSTNRRVVAVDVRPQPVAPGVEMHQTLKAAWASLRTPAEAICHVSVPPAAHSEVVMELVALGARRIIVEKPLSESAESAAEMFAVATTAGAKVVPVAMWPHSTTIQELRLRIGGSAPERLRLTQSKPRRARTTWDRGHTSALQIEMPHQVLLATFLAGPVRTVRSAELWDLRAGSRHYVWAGGARVVLEHDCGTVSELVSDLSAPRRMRRLEVLGAGVKLVAHFPTSAAAADGSLYAGNGALLWRGADRPLTRFMQAAYDRFIHARDHAISGLMHFEVMRILDAAASLAVDERVRVYGVRE